MQKLTEWAIENPIKAVVAAAVIVAAAAWLFGPETVQGWIEAVYSDQMLIVTGKQTFRS